MNFEAEHEGLNDLAGSKTPSWFFRDTQFKWDGVPKHSKLIPHV